MNCSIAFAVSFLLIFSAPAEAKKKKKKLKAAVEQPAPVIIPTFPKNEKLLWDYIQTKMRERNFYALKAAEQFKETYPNSPKLHELSVQMKDFAFQGAHFNSYKNWLEASQQSDPLFLIRTGDWESLADHELTPYGTQLRYAVELYGHTEIFLKKHKDISQSPWYWALFLSDKNNLSLADRQRSDILEQIQFPQHPTEKDDWAEVIIKLSLMKAQDTGISSALSTYEKRRQELQKIIENGSPEAKLYALAAIIQLQIDLKQKYEALAPNLSKVQESELAKLNSLIEDNKKECELYTKKQLVNVDSHKICERELGPQDIFDERLPTPIKVPTTSQVAFLSAFSNQNEIVKTLQKYLEEGNVGWVWHYLETQNKINPQDPWWMSQLGMLYLYMNKWREAENLFATTALIERFQPAAWKGRAFANYRFGHDQQARIAWMRSQKQKPLISIDMPTRLEDMEKYKKKKKRFRAKGKSKTKKKK